MRLDQMTDQFILLDRVDEDIIRLRGNSLHFVLEKTPNIILSRTRTRK